MLKQSVSIYTHKHVRMHAHAYYVGLLSN